MTGLRAAISLLTVLPVGPRRLPTDLGPTGGYFPVVGILLGGILAGIDWLLRPLFPPMLVGAILVVAMTAITRGLHVDGFMDTCDGLLGGFTRERRLEIMRDPHVGAFAVAGGMSILVLKWASVAALPPVVRLPLLVLFPCLSRWGMLVAMAAYPSARAGGMGAHLRRGLGRRHVAAGLAVSLGAGVLVAGYAGVLLVVAAAGVAWASGGWMARLLGGLTGDTYGAVNEVTEVSVLLLAYIIAAFGAELFRAALPLGSGA